MSLNLSFHNFFRHNSAVHAFLLKIANFTPYNFHFPQLVCQLYFIGIFVIQLDQRFHPEALPIFSYFQLIPTIVSKFAVPYYQTYFFWNSL